jgi:hypothetical protein
MNPKSDKYNAYNHTFSPVTQLTFLQCTRGSHRSDHEERHLLGYTANYFVDKSSKRNCRCLPLARSSYFPISVFPPMRSLIFYPEDGDGSFLRTGDTYMSEDMASFRRRQWYFPSSDSENDRTPKISNRNICFFIKTPESLWGLVGIISAAHDLEPYKIFLSLAINEICVHLFDYSITIAWGYWS